MIEQTLDIATKDGAMETFLAKPERGSHPAVFLLMDAPGIREELRDMARRLATVGYCVLLPNLYYRAGRDTIYGPQVLEHGSPGEIELYPGVHHGFAFPQRWCYDKPAAERHWERLIALYRRRLG